MTERQIKYIPLTDVRPADVNPKAHDIGSIATSILRRGFVEVPALDGRTGKLVAGHGRIEALQWLHKEGREPPEGIKTRGDEWLVPVLHGWSSKSDADAMAYLVASNRLVEAGGWDETELDQMLVEIGKAGELDGTGYDDDDIDKILRNAVGELPDLPAGERAPLQQKTFTLSDAQCKLVDEAMLAAGDEPDGTGNANGNGNALANVCRGFLGGAHVDG